MTKAFSKRAFYAISLDRVTFRFYRNAQAKVPELIRYSKNRALF